MDRELTQMFRELAVLLEDRRSGSHQDRLDFWPRGIQSLWHLWAPALIHTGKIHKQN